MVSLYRLLSYIINERPLFGKPRRFEKILNTFLHVAVLYIDCVLCHHYETSAKCFHYWCAYSTR